MPTYVYKREDGTTFEIEQRITAPSLTTCPTTGQPVKRIISAGAGLVFKGTGFYETDYVRNKEKPTTSSEKSTSISTSTDSGSSSSSTDSTSKTTKTE